MANRMSMKFYEKGKDTSEIINELKEIYKDLDDIQSCYIDEFEEEDESDNQQKILVYGYESGCFANYFTERSKEVAKIKDGITREYSSESDLFIDVEVCVSENGEWRYVRDFKVASILAMWDEPEPTIQMQPDNSKSPSQTQNYDLDANGEPTW